MQSSGQSTTINEDVPIIFVSNDTEITTRKNGLVQHSVYFRELLKDV